jgi:uncharacterized protein (DUF2267 family)
MKLDDFLEMVREGLGLKNLREADKVVRVVVGTLKANLPEDKEAIIAEALPGELSSGWEEVEPLSPDIADRAEMSIEMETPPVEHGTPTITDG